MKSEQTENNNERPKASVRYFENRDCECYPCHNIKSAGFNCLFCFCPLYFAICPGTPQYREKNGVVFKSCAACEYPHIPENYQAIIGFIATMLRGEHDE